MADCRWADAGAAASDSRDVSVGRKFDLLSGRLTLFFNESHATVTLEGPATFRVISVGEGFLSFGKLSGRVPSRQIIGGLNLATGFAVHTPRAVMLDRGAKFSVAVDKTGASVVRLMYGQIELYYPKGYLPGDAFATPGRTSWFTFGSRGAVRRGFLIGAESPPLNIALMHANHDLTTAGGPR